MINIPTARKTVQVSEESAPAVHSKFFFPNLSRSKIFKLEIRTSVPMMVGNEMFVFSHQDVRRVEDTRYFSYNRMLPNGQLQPITNYGDRWIPDIQLASLQGLMAQSRPYSPNDDLGTANSVPLSPIAGISKQMEWTMDTKRLSCPPYPMHHTKTTSMTGIVVKAKPSDHQMQKMTNGSCQTKPLTVSEGCNTSSTRITRNEPKATVTFKSCPSTGDDSDSADNESSKSKVSTEMLMPPFCKRNQNYKKKTSHKRDK